MLSSCPGQVDFPVRQVTFHSHLSNGQGLKQVICQLNCKKSNLRLAQGKQNLRATCPKSKLEFKFFFEPCHDTGNSTPYSFWTVPWVLLSHIIIVIRNKCCETGPTVYHPYPRRLKKALPFADVITKATLSPQSYKDPDPHGLNPATTSHTVVQLTVPTELTGRRSFRSESM